MEQPADDVEGRRLRPRRGALADISNRFVSTITDVAKKVTRNTRKRKLSVRNCSIIS